jgi:hypothetical protein
LTGEVPELPEFFGELLSTAPRFVQLDRTVWVNPDHVTAVVAGRQRIDRPARECSVWMAGFTGDLLVARSADEVIALLTDTATVDPNQLEIPGVA